MWYLWNIMSSNELTTTLRQLIQYIQDRAAEKGLFLIVLLSPWSISLWVSVGLRSPGHTHTHWIESHWCHAGQCAVCPPGLDTGCPWPQIGQKPRNCSTSKNLFSLSQFEYSHLHVKPKVWNGCKSENWAFGLWYLWTVKPYTRTISFWPKKGCATKKTANQHNLVQKTIYFNSSAQCQWG